MIRKAGERFNPYGDWEDQDAVWELLEDAEDDTNPRRYKSRCLIPSKADFCRDEYVGQVRDLFLWPTAFAPAPSFGRLAP